MIASFLAPTLSLSFVFCFQFLITIGNSGLIKHKSSRKLVCTPLNGTKQFKKVTIIQLHEKLMLYVLCEVLLGGVQEIRFLTLLKRS